MSTVRFEKKGDLLSYTYLTKRNSAGVTQAIGVGDIDYVELYIGGQIIDTQYSDYSTLQWPKLEAESYAKGAAGVASAGFYPLHFFFCDNWTNALPLVALQYHDVEIRIYWKTGLTATDVYQVWSDFIYLDEAERAYFAATTQNMLIKQVQRAASSLGRVQEFNFNHPVLYIGSTNPGAMTGAGNNQTELQFMINGVQSGEAMRIDPHFTEVPAYYHAPACGEGSVFCVPFALNITSGQPSGSLNFSRLDSSRLEIVTQGSGSFAAASVFYAVNWNVLKIENGMGGLMYSN